jgi:hypothetical protein
MMERKEAFKLIDVTGRAAGAFEHLVAASESEADKAFYRRMASDLRSLEALARDITDIPKD